MPLLVRRVHYLYAYKVFLIIYKVTGYIEIRLARFLYVLSKENAPFAGYKSLGKLRNLEILDLSSNKFSNSMFPFLNAATSLRTLFLRDNYMGGPSSS